MGVDGALAAYAFQKKAWIQLVLLCVLVALTYLVLGWIPLLGSVSLLVAGIWIKMGILYPTTSSFGLRRRIIARWTAKMMLAIFIVVTLIVCEAMTLTGILSGPLKAVAGGVQVGIGAALVTSYVNWQVRREQKAIPIAWWEWGLVAGSTAALLLTAIGMVFALAGLAFAFQWVLDSMNAWLLAPDLEGM